jgi:hypothetical protein
LVLFFKKEQNLLFLKKKKQKDFCSYALRRFPSAATGAKARRRKA